MGSLLDELLTNQLAVGAGEEEKEKDFFSLPPSLFFFLRSIDAPFAPHVYTRVLLASIFEFNLFYMWIMDDLVTFSFFFIDIFVRLNLFLLELLHKFSSLR